MSDASPIVASGERDPAAPNPTPVKISRPIKDYIVSRSHRVRSLLNRGSGTCPSGTRPSGGEFGRPRSHLPTRPWQALAMSSPAYHQR